MFTGIVIFIICLAIVYLMFRHSTLMQRVAAIEQAATAPVVPQAQAPTPTPASVFGSTYPVATPPDTGPQA